MPVAHVYEYSTTRTVTYVQWLQKVSLRHNGQWDMKIVRDPWQPYLCNPSHMVHFHSHLPFLLLLLFLCKDYCLEPLYTMHLLLEMDMGQTIAWRYNNIHATVKHHQPIIVRCRTMPLYQGEASYNLSWWQDGRYCSETDIKGRYFLPYCILSGTESKDQTITTWSAYRHEATLMLLYLFVPVSPFNKSTNTLCCTVHRNSCHILKSVIWKTLSFGNWK